MSERYGEREGTYRMTNMVLQSQSDWGAISRVEKGRRLERCPSIDVAGSGLKGWLLEAAVRAAGRSISVSALASSPVLYPFALGDSLGFAASENARLEVLTMGAGRDLVALVG